MFVINGLLWTAKVVAPGDSTVFDYHISFAGY